ncbi:uncharacterized protein LOC125946508 [Dermacentor silvarum]|uniref:uncharacterized protein LOC125946508 n=1 Tax=Dermacentor silvarum TaxID=543639 RepID=UPI002100726F|nr:uncharacterized protein LOC125946508 [Dermacentor silvarum]
MPLEACEMVEGQHCRKKLDDNQTYELIKRTATPPSKRFQEIRQSVRDLVNSTEDYLRELNISTEQGPSARAPFAGVRERLSPQAARGHVGASRPALLQAGHHGPLDVGQPEPVRAARQPRQLRQDAHAHRPRTGHAHRPASPGVRVRPQPAFRSLHPERAAAQQAADGRHRQDDQLRRDRALAAHPVPAGEQRGQEVRRGARAQPVAEDHRQDERTEARDHHRRRRVPPGDRIRPSVAACVDSVDFDSVQVPRHRLHPGGARRGYGG